MKTMLKKIVMLILLLSLPLNISYAAGGDHDIGEGGQGVSPTDSNKYVYFSPYNYGLRITLWDAESSTELDTVNVLTYRQESERVSGKMTFWLGGNVKTSFGSVGLNGPESYSSISGMPALGTGGSANGQKEWAESQESIKQFAEMFGLTYEELTSGKYHVLLEPLAELRMGNNAYSVIGTATEVASYNLYLQSIGVPQSVIVQNLANLILGALPKYYFLEEDHPDKGLSMASGMDGGGFVSSANIINSGWGIGILRFKDAPGPPTCPIHGPYGDSSTPPDDCLKPCPKPDDTAQPKIIKEDELNRPFSQNGSATASTIGNCGCSTSFSWRLGGVANNCVLPNHNPNSGSAQSAMTVNKLIGTRGFTTNNSTNLRLAKYMQSSNPNTTTIGFVGAPIFDRTQTGKLSDTSTNVTSNQPIFNFNVTGCNLTYSTGGTPPNTYQIPNHSRISSSQNLNQTPPTMVYKAEETVFGSPLSYTAPLPEAFAGNNGQREVIELGGEETISFFPTYKMKYYEDSNSMSYKEAWMLSSGQRQFISTPHISITSDQVYDLLGPWSRDRVDVLSGVQTVKAGNAIKPIVMTEYKVELVYYIQDPFFKTGSSRNIQLKYIPNFDHIINELSSNLYVYSNAPYTGNREMNVMGLNVPKISDSKILNKSYLSGSKVFKSTSSGRNITITRSDGKVGGLQSNTSTTVGGESPALDSGLISSLVTTGGTGNWYKEDYEGVIKVHVEETIQVYSDQNLWVETYRHISDRQDEAPIKPNPGVIVSEPSGLRHYNQGKFVMGYGTIVSPAYGMPEIRMHGKYEEFYIRGSSYDQR